MASSKLAAFHIHSFFFFSLPSPAVFPFFLSGVIRAECTLQRPRAIRDQPRPPSSASRLAKLSAVSTMLSRREPEREEEREKGTALLIIVRALRPSRAPCWLLALGHHVTSICSHARSSLRTETLLPSLCLPPRLENWMEEEVERDRIEAQHTSGFPTPRVWHAHGHKGYRRHACSRGNNTC